MKVIFKIARTELRNLFYSPVAWFLMIVFLVQCGVYYTGVVGMLTKYQDWAFQNTPSFKEFSITLTKAVFLGNNGIFTGVMQNLYLFIPLLTMGMISRETNNGTIKLLYSSPVTVRQIVLGKYLAIMLYNCLLLLIVGIFMVNGILSIKSPDYGLVLSAAFGFYLMICAYTAIGMFMSSLTSYQIVSALGTFLTFFVLTQIGNLWQQYDLVRDLTYFLSINGRTMKMVKGLITTNDVMYFALIVYMFIAFTLLRLKGTREPKPWYAKATRYVAVFALVMIIGYLTSRPGSIGYWDTTAQKINTIHGNSQKIIQQLGDEPVEVTLYANLLGGGIYRARPEQRNDYIWNLWEPFIRFKSNLTFRYAEYYDYFDGDSSLFKTFPGKNLDQIAEATAEMYNVNLSRYQPPKEIRKMIDLRQEDYRVVMQLKYKGRTAFLRTFDDPTYWPEESQVDAVLKRLADGTGPKVYFVTGDLERSIHKLGEREYGTFTITKYVRSALINQGFDCDTVSLDTQDIPADISFLVLADPKVQLSVAATAKIKKFVQDGGNMMVLGEPGKQQIINPVLQPMGVQLMNGTLIEISKDEMPHMVFPYITLAATDLAKEDEKLRQLNGWLKAGGDTVKALNPGAAGIAWSDSIFTVKPLLVTHNRNAWAKVGRLVTDSADPVFVREEGDYKLDSFTTAVSLSRQVGKKEQRIIVTGDADFLSKVREGGGNLGMAYYSWLSDGQYPIYTPRDKPKDILMNISYGRAKIERIIFVWVLPALVLIFGTILLIRRKRQ